MSRGVLSGPLAWTLARRLLADPRSRLLTSSARAALTASTLGVAALGIAMALMTGYQEDLVAKLVGANAAILVDARGVERPAEAIDAAIRATPGVARVDRVRYLEGVLTSAAGEAEITLRGAPAGAGPLAPAAGQERRAAGGEWGVRLGERLAAELGVAPGDALRLAVLALDQGRPRFAFRTLQFQGTFASGFSEFDRAWAVVPPAALDGLPGAGEGIREVALADPAAARELAATLRERLGPEALVVPWQDLNHSLFAALDLQRRALFLLLGLIVVVATFNVASTLVVLVRERMRDLGVLAALGLGRRALARVFLLYGAVLGALGTAAGLALAWIVYWTFTRFHVLSFGPEIAEVYFLDSVPLRLAAGDALAVGLFSLAVTLLGCWLPAWRAARLDPAAALRYE